MKKFLSKYDKQLTTAVAGLLVFLFWRFIRPCMLTYQEQFQLFLFDDDYLYSRLIQPGGIARYVAEFLVQLYNNVTFGAIVLAVAFVLVQVLTWLMLKAKSADTDIRSWYPLSFIPSILLLYTGSDENVMLTYTISLIISMLMAWAYQVSMEGKSRVCRYVTLAVIIPLLYWIVGPLVIIAALYMLPLSAIYAVACVLLSSLFVPYPVVCLFYGIDYYRSPEILSFMLIVIPVVALVIAYLTRLLPQINHRWSYVMAVVLLCLTVFMVRSGYDERKYNLMEYDFLVRTRNWDAIIKKSQQKMPDLPMSVSANNLALAMKGQLGDRVFDFYQNGSQGLMPLFERNFATTQLTGEVYFNIGMINTAQRYAFEAMEAIPNCDKSSRAVRRLAETNLINGNYGVARKYLRMLQKTLFYRPWALRTEKLLGDEKAINDHPLYGWLRKAKISNDDLFSESEIDKICGQLFLHNKDNKVALQYMLMVPLLDGDIPRFMRYMRVVEDNSRYVPGVLPMIMNKYRVPQSALR